MSPPGASPVVGELLAGTLLPDGTDPVCEGPAHNTPRCYSLARCQLAPYQGDVQTHYLVPAGLIDALALSGC